MPNSNDEAQRVNNQNSAQNPSPIEKSDYHKVRAILSASDFINNFVDKFGNFTPPQLGFFAKIAANATKGAIYIEDILHTNKEIECKVNQVLSSPKLSHTADYPELFNKFKQYVKTSLQKWVPDRDYPEIGYLPKELLYDQSLGEKKITKYWPEATKEQQAKYVALTFDELVLNYELVWNNLQHDSPGSLG